MKFDTCATCATCAHAQALTGLWLKLGDEYVRCTADKVEDCLHLTAKRNTCHYQPSKWTSTSPNHE